MTNYPLVGQTSVDYQDIYINVRSEFQNTLDAVRGALLYPLVSTVVGSTGKSNQYDMTYIVNTMNEWLGSRTREKIAIDTYNIANQKFETSLDINRDDIEDSALNFLPAKVQQLATIAANYFDDRLFDMINAHVAGTTLTFPVGFDGLSTFSASHVWPYGYTSTQSNLRTTGNAGKLDLTYGADNIKAAIVSLEGFLLPNEQRARSKATHLLCSSSTYFSARQILESAGLNMSVTGTESSSTVAERGSGNPLFNEGIKVVKCPELTSGYWILCDLSKPIKPFIFQMRRNVEVEELGKGSSEYYETENMSFGVSSRFGVGSGAWFTAVAGDGS